MLREWEHIHIIFITVCYSSLLLLVVVHLLLCLAYTWNFTIGKIYEKSEYIPSYTAGVNVK